MWKFSISVIILAILARNIATANPILSGKNAKEDPVSYRLPNNTAPILYDLQIRTNVDKGDFTFIGNVVIHLQVIAATKDIVVHARQLKIGAISLVSSSNPLLTYAVEHSYDEATEFLKITAIDETLTPGIYKLEIDYTGELRKDNAGFYVSSYTRANGQTVYIATTQFAPTDARHAFPCYDEPSKMAVFYVGITHGKAYSALSNMRVFGDVQDNGDGTVTTRFQPSPTMATYLLAFVVSDFVSTQLRDRIPHRIYSRPGTTDDQYFALQTSSRTLNTYEDYLDVKYDLPKMDNIAMPDFDLGAMENWGLVIYREEFLLFDDKKSTTGTKTNIATIISHEFGHQWFGNLVSPDWWTYLWLNEGFASLFACITADIAFPHWDIMQDFIVSDLQRALLSDAKESPRPMTHYVESPKDIASLFDYVSYSKAASVIEMFRHVLSKNSFKTAMHDYLTTMRHQAATDSDLFKSLVTVAQKDNIFGTSVTSDTIELMFKSWTNQGGYPLITITRNYESGTFTIHQEPFDGTDKDLTPTDSRSWWVPYNFATANNSNFNDTKMEGYLKIGDSAVTVLQGTQKWSSTDWILLNKQATSYYRVNYDLQNWKLLSRTLMDSPNEVHTHNRAQLLDDSFRFVLAKRLKFETFLDLSLYLKNEFEYAPWMTANKFLTTLNNYLSDDKDYDLFQFYVGKIVENFYDSVGVSENSGDGQLRKLTRVVAVNWACQANYGSCLDITNQRFHQLIDTGIDLEPNLRNTIYCNGLASGGETEYNFIMNHLMNSDDQAERRELMSSAVGCIQNDELLSKYLKTSIEYTSAVNYRETERLNVLGGVVNKGAVQLKAGINFLIENHVAYSKLPADVAQNGPLLLAIRNIANRVVSKDQETHFEQLLTILTGAQRIEESDLTAVRATVKTNLDWIEENRDDFIGWLTKFKKDNTGGGAANIVASTSAIAAVVILTIRSLL